MTEKQKLYLVVSLFLTAIPAYWMNRSSGPVTIGATGDERFVPLQVSDPSLRLDLLARARGREYSGEHRNIFGLEAPPPTPKQVAEAKKEKAFRSMGPQQPPPPPPVTVPATFFGYALNPQSGKRQAFFTNGEDVFVVEEGGMLLNHFRLISIGNNSADLEETSSGRHATVPLLQPTPGGGGPSTPSPGAPPPVPVPGRAGTSR